MEFITEKTLESTLLEPRPRPRRFWRVDELTNVAFHSSTGPFGWLTYFGRSQIPAVQDQDDSRNNLWTVGTRDRPKYVNQPNGPVEIARITSYPPRRRGSGPYPRLAQRQLMQAVPWEPLARIQSPSGEALERDAHRRPSPHL